MKYIILIPDRRFIWTRSQSTPFCLHIRLRAQLRSGHTTVKIIQVFRSIPYDRLNNSLLDITVFCTGLFCVQTLNKLACLIYMKTFLVTFDVVVLLIGFQKKKKNANQPFQSMQKTGVMLMSVKKLFESGNFWFFQLLLFLGKCSD